MMENLPTRLCLHNKSLHSFVPNHPSLVCKISGQQPTQLHMEFPRIHDFGHSKKTMRKSLHCLIHLSASLYLSPADCFKEILFEQWGTSCWNKLPFAAGGVICESASTFPTSYLHGCSFQLELGFQTSDAEPELREVCQ